MSEKKEKVLIVEDNDEYRLALAEAIENDFDILMAATREQADQQITQGIDVVVVDIRLNEADLTNREGLRLLEDIKSVYPNLPVVMMTNYADIDVAVEAMRLGASDFIQKTRLDIREFRKVIHNAVKNSQQERRLFELEEELKRLEPWELVGADPKIQEIQQRIDIVAQDGFSTVLIRGETGTGKELVARAVYERGRRKTAPFIVVTPALSSNLIESELFGHTKGAFTGAHASRVGHFEKAQGGVLFLDEIGDLSLDIQIKLLRFLENRTITRVGSTQEIKVDLQIVAATNINLEDAIKEGKFREDLYFRLKTVEIKVPPLRERVEDIPLLVDHFMHLFYQQGRTQLIGFSLDALSVLKNYAFPGNVRELKSIVEWIMMMAKNQNHRMIEVKDLPLDVQKSIDNAPSDLFPDFSDEGIDLDAELAKVELSYIQKALQITDGKKNEAWKMLGLNDRFALRRRVKNIGETYPDLIEYFPFVQKLYYE